MKITDITTQVVNGGMRNWIFVRVETDQPGLFGIGEATLEWKTAAVIGCVEDLKALLIGHDPRDIEQCHQRMVRHSFWRLGIIGMTAVSGIDVALWDIAGKALNVPVWRLLGGKVRDRVRVYTHLGMGECNAVYGSMSIASAVERARAVVERGYDAFKIVCTPYTHYAAGAKAIGQFERLVGDVRVAVGDEVDIMLDFHGRPASAAAALGYIAVAAQHRPLFVEEPVPPGDSEMMAEVARAATVPIATGERLSDKQEFRELFVRRGASIAQPDLCHAGGLSEGRKIAAMAEAFGIGLAPHNPLGPLASIAALHFAIATHNFIIQEEMSGVVPWFNDILDHPIERIGNAWQIPHRAGLGVTIDEAVAARHPRLPEDHTVVTDHALLDDGTLVSW